MAQQLPVPAPPTASMPYGVQTPVDRANTSQEIREQAAAFERAKPLPNHLNNGDEEVYEAKYGNYSKGLLHDQYGVVDRGAYHALYRATKSGIPLLFQNIPLGGSIKLVNPQAGLAFDLEGADSHSLTIPPAPAVVSAERAAEMVELYWMAICRDIPFSSYHAEAAVPSSKIARAIADLNKLGPAFKGPRDEAGNVTAQTLFRGATPGETKGPYISQFFLQSAGFGDLSSVYDPQSVQGQLYYGYVDGKDYMMDWNSWMAVQNGQSPFHPPPANLQFGPDEYKTIPGSKPSVDACGDPVSALQKDTFYLYNGRMGSAFVHVDELYQAYFMAALNLLDAMKGASYDQTNPYKAGTPGGATEAGFGTFGNPHVATLVAEVATRALKAQWYQKWFVHRTLRPEAYGGMVHATMSKQNGDPQFEKAPDFPLHHSIISSDAMSAVHALPPPPGSTAGWLLPMAFKEGSPQHPSYGSGHATVAGACATIIKAFFDEDMPMPCVVESDVTGKKLVPYLDPRTGKQITVTIGEEANKIAGNVGMFRNHAGVHWRSDHEQSILLGEQIAISILQDQKYLYNEPFAGWKFTTFNGEKVVI